MTNLLYSALIVLLFAQLACSDSPKETDQSPGDTDIVSADCEEILTEMKEAQGVHKADYNAKGNAFIAWKKYYDQLHSESYLDTESPLIVSVKKCESGEGDGEDFCKGVEEKYNELTAQEKSAKQTLTQAEEKSKESKRAYNLKLKEAADMNCIIAGR